MYVVVCPFDPIRLKYESWQCNVNDKTKLELPLSMQKCVMNLLDTGNENNCVELFSVQHINSFDPHHDVLQGNLVE
jgi:hypothetical protein